LDTNILIALAWPNHVHHGEVMEWFLQKAVSGFCTCPITQTGFVRISSNPAFTANAVTPAEALTLLRKISELPGHEFWPDDISLLDATVIDPDRVHGPRQLTDVYLVALAVRHAGHLVTFDRSISVQSAKGAKAAHLVFL